MHPIIDKYTRLKKDNKLEYEYDEFMLYDMIVEAGLGICPQAVSKENHHDPVQPAFRPTHGMHLAKLRSLFVKKRRVCTDTFIQEMNDLKRVINDPLFHVIESNFKSKVISNTYF